MSFEAPSGSTNSPELTEAEFNRRYRRVPEAHRPTLRQALKLSGHRERLDAESIDATAPAKELLMDPDLQKDSPASIDAANAKLQSWGTAQLEARGGQPFVAKVPVFSPWHHTDEPDYRYFAVDEQTGLSVNPTNLGNPLVRDHVAGAELFSTPDQMYLKPATLEPENIGKSYGPQTTWGEVAAHTDEGMARLAAHPAVTGVVLPEQPPATT